MYIGGGILVDNRTLNSIFSGMLYKDRKDNIYQLNIGINTSGSIIYGGGLFYKIKL